LPILVRSQRQSLKVEVRKWSRPAIEVVSSHPSRVCPEAPPVASITQGTVKVSEFETIPEAGFATVTTSSPDFETALAGTAAVTSWLFTNVVVSGLPFHCTIEPEVKFDPTTLNVNAPPPCKLLLGDSALILILIVRAEPPSVCP